MQNNRLIKMPEVAHRVGRSRSAIYEAIARGTFCVPVRVGRSIRFLESEVEKWIADRAAERQGTERIRCP